ncbi:hypothetical protein NAS2_1600 [Conexivisphaera calida]|uniref:Uncharacterized protein n=1 Tax=Conexivisphaera calida TaxID=1874277 RepID=A0A4P2VEB8_9ARCH|nr:hypothetical protein NAS2_1600 [Conexivisphaera calida]
MEIALLLIFAHFERAARYKRYIYYVRSLGEQNPLDVQDRDARTSLNTL